MTGDCKKHGRTEFFLVPHGSAYCSQCFAEEMEGKLVFEPDGKPVEQRHETISMGCSVGVTICPQCSTTPCKHH